MSLLLLNLLMYFAVGFGEWALAIRRTSACANGETSILVLIVFIENLVGLWVLSSFIRSNDWYIAIVYSVGGALGSLMVSLMNKRKAMEKVAA